LKILGASDRALFLVFTRDTQSHRENNLELIGDRVGRRLKGDKFVESHPCRKKRDKDGAPFCGGGNMRRNGYSPYRNQGREIQRQKLRTGMSALDRAAPIPGFGGQEPEERDLEMEWHALQGIEKLSYMHFNRVKRRSPAQVGFVLGNAFVLINGRRAGPS
jgi:hypothetical protein